MLFRHTHDPDLKVNVTDLDVQVFKSQTIQWICFIFCLMVDTGQRFYSAIPASMLMTSRSRYRVTNFDCKHFRSSYFPNHMMDLVHIWYDDRHRFRVLFSDTLT